MEARLLRGALARRKGTVVLAVLAVAIGASVAAALLHVSGDVSRQLSTELRALGPNLLVVPAGARLASRRAPEVPAGRFEGARAFEQSAGSAFLVEGILRARLRGAGIEGTPLLYMVARVKGEPVLVIGADLDEARRLHPGWRVPPGSHPSLVGARLLRRLGVRSGAPLTLEFPGTGRRVSLPAGAPLEAGGADDEAWWLPLADVQRLAGLEGRASLAQARVAGGIDEVESAARALERDGELRALPIRSLSATEAGLLERMRRLMALVTIAALVAAGLCAFGTLTDLALERRREIALMKALGAARADVVRQFAVEAVAIGLVGGVAGCMLGIVMAEIIGRQVFHAAIAIRWDVPPVVLLLSLAVAGLSSLGPIRLALGIEPATVLKGD